MDPFLSALLTPLMERLVARVVEEGRTILEVTQNLNELKRTLARVQTLLEEAENEQVHNEALQELEDAAYDADDIIDEITIRLSGVEETNQNDNNQVRNPALTSLMFTTLPRKIRNVLNRLNDLRENLMHYNNPRSHERDEQTSFLSDECLVLGREDVASEIISILTDSASRENKISVISIVGMPGVGKTTLARMVYNDQQIAGYFDFKSWVSLHSGFHVNEVMKDIITAAPKSSTHNQSPNREQLQRTLCQILPRKRFLLVLDDLREVSQRHWDTLRQTLRSSGAGGIIIVTSRSPINLIMINCEMKTYHLNCLSDEHCWKVLQGAFENQNANVPSSLSAIGRQIAKKCQGLPWATEVLGTMMGSREYLNEDKWTDILRSNIWDLPKFQEHNFLSPRDVPKRLKLCFEYYAIFSQNHIVSKDYTIFSQNHIVSKDELVLMWMAQGFIPEDQEPMESTGSKYFDELLSMSFFQEIGQNYRMHGLIHHLAESISGVKCFKMEVANGNTQMLPTLTEHVRHVSVFCESSQTVTFDTFYNCRGLRTLVLFRESEKLFREYAMRMEAVPIELFRRLGRLRVLDLSGTHISTLTAALGNLIHLRYLDLSKTLLKWLPETIGNLYKLQTLLLRNCSSLRWLPERTEDLINLRHLDFEGSGLMYMPSEFGNLIHLQTLTTFIVGVRYGRISELRFLRRLRGLLCIKKLENVNIEDISMPILDNKEFIRRLKLEWSDVQCDDRIQMQALDRLRPHGNLQELTIKRYGGQMFPGWLGNHELLSNLVSLCLSECKRCPVLPVLGSLQMLKHLEIAGMTRVKKLDNIFLNNNRNFPLLETLKLRDLPNLSVWSMLQMPLLQELIIDNCPLLTRLPPFHDLRSLNVLEVRNCLELFALPQGFANNLQRLTIIGCSSRLIARYQEGGQDYDMIRGVPSKEIIE